MNIKFSKLPKIMPSQIYQTNYLPFSLGAVSKDNYYEITTPLRCTDYVSDYLFVGNKVVDRGFMMYRLFIKKNQAIKFVRARNKVAFFYFRDGETTIWAELIQKRVSKLHSYFELPQPQIYFIPVNEEDVFRRNKIVAVVQLDDFWTKSPALMSLFLKYVRDGEKNLLSCLSVVKEILPSVLKIGFNLNLRTDREYANVCSTIHCETGIDSLRYAFMARRDYKDRYDKDTSRTFKPVIDDYFSAENKT